MHRDAAALLVAMGRFLDGESEAGAVFAALAAQYRLNDQQFRLVSTLAQLAVRGGVDVVGVKEFVRYLAVAS